MHSKQMTAMRTQVPASCSIGHLWEAAPGAGPVCIGIEGAAAGGSGGHACLGRGEVGDCAGLPCCCYLKKEMRH